MALRAPTQRIDTHPGDILFHPATLTIVQLCVIAAFNGFTKADSRKRLLVGLPLTAILAWYPMISSYERTGSSFLGEAFGTPPIGYLLQYIDTALIGRWEWEAGGPRRIIERNRKRTQSSAAKQQQNTDALHGSSSRNVGRWEDFRARLAFGAKSLFDIRGVNKPWEIKSIPYYSNADTYWIPSRSTFLFGTGLKLAIFGLLGRYLRSPAADSAFGLDASLYSPEKVFLFRRLSDVTIQELGIRLLTTAQRFALIMCELEMAFGLLALPAVALELWDKNDIRPLFDSPLQAYTVRRFWSPFWHQIWRRRFTSIAHVVTIDFLKFRQGSRSARYTSTLVVFLLSGLVHYANNIAEGMAWQEPGAVTFFVAQAAAIILEDAVGALTGLQNRRPGWVLKSLGYIWVLSFLAMVGPHWIYPSLARRLK